MSQRHTRKRHNTARLKREFFVRQLPWLWFSKCHGSLDSLRAPGTTAFKLLGRMPGRREPMDGGRLRELSAEDTGKDLPATSRMVTAEHRLTPTAGPTCQRRPHITGPAVPSARPLCDRASDDCTMSGVLYLPHLVMLSSDRHCTRPVARR